MVSHEVPNVLVIPRQMFEAWNDTDLVENSFTLPSKEVPNLKAHRAHYLYVQMQKNRPQGSEFSTWVWHIKGVDTSSGQVALTLGNRYIAPILPKIDPGGKKPQYRPLYQFHLQEGSSPGYLDPIKAPISSNVEGTDNGGSSGNG
jgi:hypothetical protein